MKTKETLDKLVAQAKESVKVLETLQQEGMARAKEYLNVERAREAGEHYKDAASRMANETLVTTLKKLGFATRAEVRELEKKVEDLASELRGQISKLSRKAPKSAKAGNGSKGKEPETNA